MKLKIEEPIVLEIPDKYFNLPESYNLTYTKADGQTQTYKVVSINEITNTLIKATVQGKGYRSFRIENIVSFKRVN